MNYLQNIFYVITFIIFIFSLSSCSENEKDQMVTKTLLLKAEFEQLSENSNQLKYLYDNDWSRLMDEGPTIIRSIGAASRRIDNILDSKPRLTSLGSTNSFATIHNEVNQLNKIYADFQQLADDLDAIKLWSAATRAIGLVNRISSQQSHVATLDREFAKIIGDYVDESIVKINRFPVAIVSSKKGRINAYTNNLKFVFDKYYENSNYSYQFLKELQKINLEIELGTTNNVLLAARYDMKRTNPINNDLPLSLRSKSRGGRKIGSVPMYEDVVIFSESDGRAEIYFDGKFGYVKAGKNLISISKKPNTVKYVAYRILELPGIIIAGIAFGLYHLFLFLFGKRDKKRVLIEADF